MGMRKRFSLFKAMVTERCRGGAEAGAGAREGEIRMFLVDGRHLLFALCHRRLR